MTIMESRPVAADAATEMQQLLGALVQLKKGDFTRPPADGLDGRGRARSPTPSTRSSS